MRKIFLIVITAFAINLANAIVINANTQNLYLGDNNVSCGRYTLEPNSTQSDVQSFCKVVGSEYANGTMWLRVQTTEVGVVDCSFNSGRLIECFKDN
jgi:hypothetical protein